MNNDLLFWQTRIKITQSPHPEEPKKELEKQAKKPLPSYQDLDTSRSFLMDPFGYYDSKSYGLEISAEKRIEWTFFMKANSENEALKQGYSWLSELKYQFLGLDGIVQARAITQVNIKGSNQVILEEITIPGGLLRNKINLIEKFTSIFYFNKTSEIRLYLFWKRNPPIETRLTPDESNYSLRIFLVYDKESIDESDLMRIRGFVEFLCLNIENLKGERAKLRKVNDVDFHQILSGEVFQNCKNITLHNKYRSSLIQNEINFDFPEHLPLPRLPILKNENVRYIDVDNSYIKSAIGVSKHVKNGIVTEHTTYIAINKLPQDLVIFGKSGSGKTYFLSHFIRELSTKAPNVGILSLNVAKELQEGFYKGFSIYKYSDEDFHIPYFIEDSADKREKRLQETASYICASLGLKNVFEKIIYRTMVGFIHLENILPEDFYRLLTGVENYMISNPYGPEEQSNLLQAFRNRMNTFDEPKIQGVLKMTGDIPDWMKKWMEGENIYLDLSMCSKFVKLLVVNAIFQLIRTVTRDIEAEKLRNLIVIDEAHAILEKPITTNSDDADFIMKEQMVKIFSELLKEYRSRGVGFVIVDQNPDRLFDDVASQPSIKILFRLDHPNNILFSENIEERQILTQLENRLIMVINGTTGEKYLGRSIDFHRIN
jgi:hypothetical protein